MAHIVIGILLTSFVLPGLNRSVTLPGWLSIGIAILLAAGVVEGIRRYHGIRTFLNYLAPAILVIPALFLLDSRIGKILKSGEGLFQTIPVRSQTPVVFIVFDEFPLTSIMDYDQKIDSVRYPNFARLSQDSVWYRNATTSAAGTGDSLTAMITGLYPQKDRLPAASDYPRNLFTLLSASYDLNVVENGTKFFPGSMRSGSETALPVRMKALIMDLSAVYLQIILPADLSQSFPRISQTWGGFWDQRRNGKGGKPDASTEPAEIFARYLETIHRSNKPALLFHHLVLPHIPWKYLPSGKQYEYRYFGYVGVDGLNRFEKWTNDDWVVNRGYQRHLLQVGFVDRLLGQLLEKLKAAGLYDKSLIIITADHGASFYPGMPRRDVTSATYQDILPVPLFVKFPAQKIGRINDGNIQTIDLLPTIIDVLKIPVNWKLEGQSILNQNSTARSRKTIYIGPETIQFEPELTRKNETLIRKLKLFGSGTTEDRLYKSGPFANLIDQSLNQVADQTTRNFPMQLNDADLYNRVDVNSNILPVFITGRTAAGSGEPLYLGIAVNGKIQAVTRTFSSQDGKVFGAMVPETSFHSGHNQIDVFPLTPSMSKIVHRTATHKLQSSSP
jgi:hypothetical protein